LAEIRIEPKRRGLGWLWLFLALVIVAVLAWYFLYPGRTPATPPAPAPPTTGSLDRTAPATHGFAMVAHVRRVESRDQPGGSDGQQG
jgi:hypothetical protein